MQKNKKTTVGLSRLQKGIKDIKSEDTNLDNYIVFHFHSVESSIIEGDLTLDDSFVNGIKDLSAIKQYLSEVIGEEIVIYW